MTKCQKCGKIGKDVYPFGLNNTPFSNIIRKLGYIGGEILCYDCQLSIIEEAMKLEKDGVIKIECPFCHKEFHPEKRTPTTNLENVGRGLVFLPWGVVKALKNKPYVECPHCHMKIPQG